VSEHLDPEVFWLVADHLAQRGALQEALAAFGALANSQPGRETAENAALRCADLLLHHLHQPAQAIGWYRSVSERGKNPDNVARAARGVADAERALALVRPVS
jgi:hypothetical protein